MSFELLYEGGGGKGNLKYPRAGLEPKNHHSGTKEFNILVLGMRGVGKTALTVRYLTRRFIGDYDSEVEMLYSHSTALDGKHITLHILDTVGQMSTEGVSESQVLWADGIFVVYAINDQHSFDVARTIVDHVHAVRTEDQFVVALIANKCDLIDRKQVSDTDVSRLCAEYNVSFFETTPSESHSTVVVAFTELTRQVRVIHKKREKLSRFMSNPAVAAKLQIQQSFKNFAEKAWRSRTSTL